MSDDDREYVLPFTQISLRVHVTNVTYFHLHIFILD